MKPPRITAPFLVAVFALVVAVAAGSAYAGAKIGSKQIKNNSIRTVDVKNKSLTGKDIQFGSIPTDDLKRKCSGAEVKVAGLCIDKYASGPSSYEAANLDCHAENGRLMSRDEFLILATEYVDDITWANGMITQYEFLSTFYSSGGDLTPTATDLSGNVDSDAGAENYWHRCVTYP